jgi:hypothetical protein
MPLSSLNLAWRSASLVREMASAVSLAGLRDSTKRCSAKTLLENGTFVVRRFSFFFLFFNKTRPPTYKNHSKLDMFTLLSCEFRSVCREDP